MLFLPTIFLAVIQLFLAVLLLRVYPATTKKKQVLLLFFITITLTGWTVINTILLRDIQSVDEINEVNIINGVGYLLGGIAVWQIYSFSDNYPVTRSSSVRKNVVKSILFSLFLLSYFSPISGTNSFDELTNTANYETGTYGFVFAILIFVCLSLFTINVSRSIRQFPDSKKQARNLMTGLILTTVQAIIFILFLPTVFGQKDIFYVLGYASPVYFVVFTSYGLLRQQLFDFKDVAARATGYLFSTTFILVVYASLGYLLQLITSPNSTVERSQFLSSVVITVVLIILYPSMKKIFDRITNRIFFRDAYDPQTFLDELNKSLVSNIEIENLLRKSSQIIEANLKSQFCSFFIRDTAYFKSRLIGDYDSKLTSEEVSLVQELLPRINKMIILSDENIDSDDERTLTKLLKKNDIEILVRLLNASEYTNSGVGYLLIGTKRSGNAYNKLDLKILEIVANELVIAIQNALRFEEIEQFNATLQKKIEDATKELKKTNEKLKALDEAKDEFISMASHQLRTPLTSVKGYLSMLAEGDAGKLNETQRKFINQAFISSQRMVYLIADLLNVSRLKTGKFVIESAPVYLPDVVESEIAQLYETVKSRGITMSYDKPKQFPTLNLDETKLRQVIMNFADNAIYYTPSGGKIVVALKEVGESVEFTVTDNGMGVPKNEQQHLFTKFYRAGNARKARPDGTGLGLFMAKKVVIAQGGSLVFDSTEGKGSTFGFRFTNPQPIDTHK